MPLPLFFIAAAAATGLFGVGKTIKAVADTSEANNTNKRANEIVEAAKKCLERARQDCGDELQQLGQTKASILASSVLHFVQSFGQLKNVNFRGSEGLNEMGKLCIDAADFKELRDLGNFATHMMGGMASGALGGALTAFGAYSAAGTFAAASTGTAIASLSGAAATNATLAFFGGGSLAAGGFGVARGTMVLGGLVAGPALAIMGLVVGAKASKAKDEAYSNLAKAHRISEELMVAVDMCHAISSKCQMFVNLLNRLDRYFIPLIDKIDEAIRQHGTDYNRFSQEQKQVTAAAASIAKAIKTVLDTPILDAKGNVTPASSRILQQINPEVFVRGLERTVATSSSKKNVAIAQQELSVEQIVSDCASRVRQLSASSLIRAYDNERSDNHQLFLHNFSLQSMGTTVCGMMDWERLIEMMRVSYKIDCTAAEYAKYIVYFGVPDYVALHALKVDLQRFIFTHQVSYLVELYAKTLHDPLTAADVEWEALTDSLFRIYGVKIHTWQLSTLGKNSIRKVINNIITIITMKKSEDSGYLHFTASQFFKKLA